MLMKEIKLEGIIYKIKLVNQLTMIFHKVNLAKQSVDLIQCGPILSFNFAPPDLNFWLRHWVTWKMEVEVEVEVEVEM